MLWMLRIILWILGFVGLVSCLLFCSYVCLLFGAKLPAVVVNKWLGKSLVDALLLLIIYKSFRPLMVFTLSWVSVKWFSDIGIEGVFTCVPCRKRKREQK